MKVFFGKRATSAILLALIAVILGLIVLGSYYAFQRFESKGSESLSNVSTPIQEEEPVSPGVPPPGETVPPGPGGFNYKIRVMECNGDCSDEGNPDDICKDNYGEDWYAFTVDCENVDVGDEEFHNYKLSDISGIEWCAKGGDTDLTIACKKGPEAPSERVIRVIQITKLLHFDDEGTYTSKTPDELCEDYSGWRAVSVDCENVDVSGDRCEANDGPAYYVADTSHKVDWCKDNKKGDFTVTCVPEEEGPKNIHFVVVDTKDRQKAPEPLDEICQDKLGNTEARALAVDSDLSDTDSGEIDLLPSEGHRKNWFDDTDPGDFVVVCKGKKALPLGKETPASPFSDPYGWVERVAVGPNGEYIYTGARDPNEGKNIIRKIDNDTLKQVKNYPDSGRINSLETGPGGNLSAGVLGEDGHSDLLKLDDDLTKIWRKDAASLSIAISPDGKIYTHSFFNVFKFSSDGSVEREKEIETRDVAVSPEGDYVYLGENYLKKYGNNLEDLKWESSQNRLIHDIVVGPEGYVYISNKDQNQVLKINQESGEEVWEFDRFDEEITDIEAGPNGKYLYVSSSPRAGEGENIIKQIDISCKDEGKEDEECVGWTFDKYGGGQSNKITDIAVSPDGKYVYSTSRDGTVRKIFAG